MIHLDTFLFIDQVPVSGNYMLTADIGGTNTSFGLFEVSQELPVLVLLYKCKSQQVTDYTSLIKQVCDRITSEWNIIVKQLCIGAAGVISSQRLIVKPTNLKVEINIKEIEKVTGLQDVELINDFEAAGLGIDYIDQKSIITINRGAPWPHGHRACIGAGTGMGKVALLWNSYHKEYLPVVSEGGHSDCAGQAQEDFKFFDFLQKRRGYPCPVSWEDVLSGSGLQLMYLFLGEQRIYQPSEWSKKIAQDNFNPDKISYYAKQNDPQCKDTFLIYTRFYARCAKNFVLDTLSLGGLYIAGGIAAKNVMLFKDENFLSEFKACSKQSYLLRQTPVLVITDYSINLYGSVKFMRLKKKNIIS